MTEPVPTQLSDVGYAYRVLAAFAFEGTDGVWWRTDGVHAPVTFFAQCSDLFEWGTADLERIDPADLPLLEQSVVDAKAAGGELWKGELFVARKRGMRPQGACYKNIPEALWPLFNACGPARERNLFNPHPIPAAKNGGSDA